ncbi:hypothetical protein QTP88_012873 [Uroleucon formosanum]
MNMYILLCNRCSAKLSWIYTEAYRIIRQFGFKYKVYKKYCGYFTNICTDYKHIDMRTLEEGRRSDVRLDQIFKELQNLRTDKKTLIVIVVVRLR